MFLRRLVPRSSWILAALAGILVSTASTGHQAGAAAMAGTPSRPAAAVAAPRAIPWASILAALYVLLIAAAEVLVSIADARWGLSLHIGILTALLVHSTLATQEPHQKLFLALTLAPIIRILSLSMPLEEVDLVYWYAIVGAPLMIGAFVVARTLGLSWRNMGFRLGSLRVQGLVACTGVAFGITEYYILRPEPLIDEFSWSAFWMPALILLIGTGFNEEFVFRGVMQSASGEALGKRALLYVTVVFAVLHIGYKSVIDVAFVFSVGLMFAYVVARTRSLLGVTVSHGITNIALYLVVPFLGIGAAAAPAISVQNMEETAYGFSHETERLQRLLPPATATAGPTPTAEPSAVAALEPTSEPLPEPALEERPAPSEDAGPTELYVVEPGDTLSTIATMFETTVDELLRLNDLPEPSLVYTGQSLLVPQRAQPPPEDESPETTVHVLQVGETLATIAASYGTTIEAILELNDLADPNVIPAGESILVPVPP